jgi:hypothetical protein
MTAQKESRIMFSLSQLDKKIIKLKKKGLPLKDIAEAVNSLGLKTQRGSEATKAYVGGRITQLKGHNVDIPGCKVRRTYKKTQMLTIPVAPAKVCVVICPIDQISQVLKEFS